jgi:uncharacterized damage-inducible protein DinB
VNLKAAAIRGLKGSSRMILQDLAALPEDAFDKSFGEKTRTVADMIFEVNLVNDHVGMVIRGEEPFAWPEDGYVKAPPDFRGKELVIAAFEESSERIIATVEAFSEAHVEEIIEVDGQDTTRFDRCQFVIRHMWYHSGQLNFIQTLLGDDGWHWS